MRAPQYGHNSGKRRVPNPFAAPTGPVHSLTVTLAIAAPTGKRALGVAAKAIAGHYNPERDKRRSRNDRRTYQWATFRPR